MRGFIVILKRVILGLILAITAGCVPQAVALDVDFDSDLIQVQLYVGNLLTLRNVDGDGNGLKEDDQLGMLSQILDGGEAVADISPTRVTELQAAYTFNFNTVPDDLIVNISGVGTVNLIDELQTTNPALGGALRRVLSGILTIADTQTIAYVNSLADQLVVKLLTGTPQADQISNVQGQINFDAGTYQTYGSAGNEPNYIGAAGDIDEDTESNLDEYNNLPEKSRENWLISNEIGIALRIVNLTGGGTKITGTPLDFAVSSAGAAGEVTYTWFKGTPGSGTQVATGTSFNIPFANTGDTGSYYVVLTDGVYTRTSPALTLTVVFVNIFFTQQITGGSRVVGGSKTFAVGVQGGQPGPYTYVWKKGATVLPETGPSWTIPVLATTDSGQYSVTVSSNGGGDAITSGPVTLTVTNPASITVATQPQSVSVPIGTPHTFSIVVVGGSGSYSYVWRKGGIPIPGAPNQSTYAIPTVLNTSAGSYSCVVTDTVNATSVTSSNATLVVTGGLTVAVQPQGATIGLGADYTMSVSVQGGSGNYNYDWRKGGSSLGAANQSSYTIEDATADATGDYSCYISDVENEVNFVLSNSATVTVNTGGITVTQQPLSNTYFVGNTVVLNVAATGGSNTFNYTWLKEGEPLGAANAPSLVLTNVDTEDTGAYRCRISDKVQIGVEVLSNIANINVIDTTPLVLELQPESGYAYTGDAITFTVSVTGGSGAYNYTWTRDDVPVCDCNEASFTIGSLELTDGGTYRCTITDQLYDTLSVNTDGALLEVGEQIEFTVQPVGADVIAGENVVLTAEATGGIGELIYYWELNGEYISSAPNLPTLDLKAARLLEAGVYKCVVSDNYEIRRSAGATVNVSLVDVPMEVLSYNVNLAGANAVPPVTTNASGRVFGALTRLGEDPAAGATFSYNSLQTVNGGDQLVLFAGAEGTNGEVMITFGPALLSQSGSVELTEEETSIVFSGLAYFGVTSATYPNSEIRAQVEVVYVPPLEVHSADQDGNYSFSLSELLRIIQFYNTGSLSCLALSEDGYLPGPGDTSCPPHSSDYNPQNWVVSLSELLRAIQIYNFGSFEPCESGEDGFCLPL